MESRDELATRVSEGLPGDALSSAAIVGADPQAQATAQKHGLRVLAILSALMGFASISTDFYLPAMPVMGASFHAMPGMMAWTVSSYLIGFSLGQLIWGPIGDRFGRRTPIAIGLVLFVIGSAGCAIANSVPTMIGWRLIQAAGACASVVLARAMVRDLYTGARAASMLSNLMTVMAIAPLIGPLLGGQILLYASWHAIFWTLVAIGVLTLAALWTLPETLPKEMRSEKPVGQVIAGYFAFLGDRQILCYAGAGGFFYGGVFAYVAGTPLAYISYHRLSPQLYGFLFGAGVLGIMGSNLINARWVPRYGSDRIMLAGSFGAMFAGVATGFSAWSDWGGLATLALSLFIFISMTGFIVANSIIGALADHPRQAGTLSALIGAVQYGSGVVGSALVGAFSDGTPKSLGVVMALCGVGTFASAAVLPYRHRKDAA